MEPNILLTGEPYDLHLWRAAEARTTPFGSTYRVEAKKKTFYVVKRVEHEVSVSDFSQYITQKHHQILVIIQAQMLQSVCILPSPSNNPAVDSTEL